IPWRATKATASFGLTPPFAPPSFVRSLRPLPQAGGNACGQPVPQLTRQHDELPTMMSLVGHEVAEEVHEIRREVLPGGTGHRATSSHTDLDQRDDAFAAPR